MKKSKLQNTTTIDITGKRIIPNLYTSHAGDYLPGDILDANSTMDKISEAVATEITCAELKKLRDNSNLVPGKQYRITDYMTTTMQENTRSASHQFDIIVRADSADTLNERAWAVQHEGDEYFKDARLEAWELKYTLENIQWSVVKGASIYTDDELWFVLAGTTEIDGQTYKLWYNEEFASEEGATPGYLATVSNGVNDGASTIDIDANEIITSNYSTIQKYIFSDIDGKGTILWMKDEWGNECPYDFKNIQFKRWKATDAISGRGGLNGLYMVAEPDNAAKNLSVDDTEDYIWAYTFSSDNSGGDQTDFSLGGHNVHNNVFKPYGDLLPNNVLFGGDNYGNSFGLNCYNNSWGNDCYYNSCGNRCNNNSWGNDCYYNSWGNSCNSNSWGNNCYNNSWGNDCSRNSWGNFCQNNSWGNSCQNNSWGNSCGGNSWGNSCNSNSWGNSCYSNSWGNEVTYSTVFDGVQDTQITTTEVKYVQVLNSVQGTSSSKLTLTFAANKTYTQVAAKTSAGALKIYVPGDLA